MLSKEELIFPFLCSDSTLCFCWKCVITGFLVPQSISQDWKIYDVKGVKEFFISVISGSNSGLNNTIFHFLSIALVYNILTLPKKNSQRRSYYFILQLRKQAWKYLFICQKQHSWQGVELGHYLDLSDAEDQAPSPMIGFEFSGQMNNTCWIKCIYFFLETLHTYKLSQMWLFDMRTKKRNKQEQLSYPL